MGTGITFQAAARRRRRREARVPSPLQPYAAQAAPLLTLGAVGLATAGYVAQAPGVVAGMTPVLIATVGLALYSLRSMRKLSLRSAWRDGGPASRAMLATVVVYVLAVGLLQLRFLQLDHASTTTRRLEVFTDGGADADLVARLTLVRLLQTALTVATVSTVVAVRYDRSTLRHSPKPTTPTPAAPLLSGWWR